MDSISLHLGFHLVESSNTYRPLETTYMFCFFLIDDIVFVRERVLQNMVIKSIKRTHLLQKAKLVLAIHF